LNLPVVLIVVLLAYVLMTRQREEGAYELGQGMTPDNPIVPRPNIPTGRTPLPPNANNTGDVNCVTHPDVCRRWSCAQADAGLANTTAGASLGLGLVSGGAGVAIGGLWGAGVGLLTKSFGRDSCEGSPSVSFVGCDHSLPIGAPVFDSLGNPAKNCMGVKAPLTSVQLDQKYASKRSGDHIVGAGAKKK